MKNHQLKRCPFCGGKGKFRRVDNTLPNGAVDRLFKVECEMRECQISTLPWYPQRAAAESWNKRTK
jgi:hypothetical protein